MSEKQWEKLKAFLEENGIEYHLKRAFIFRGVSAFEIILPLVESGVAKYEN